jgi:hypothetical protein
MVSKSFESKAAAAKAQGSDINRDPEFRFFAKRIGATRSRLDRFPDRIRTLSRHSCWQDNRIPALIFRGLHNPCDRCPVESGHNHDISSHVPEWHPQLPLFPSLRCRALRALQAAFGRLSSLRFGSVKSTHAYV